MIKILFINIDLKKFLKKKRNKNKKINNCKRNYNISQKS